MFSHVTCRNDRLKSDMFSSTVRVWDVKRWRDQAVNLWSGLSCRQLLWCSCAKHTHSIRFCKHFIHTVSTSPRPTALAFSTWFCLFHTVPGMFPGINMTLDLSTLTLSVHLNLNIQYSSPMTRIQAWYTFSTIQYKYKKWHFQGLSGHGT